MSSAKKNAIAVLGAGSWGTALALLLTRNGHAALLWGNDPAGQARLEQERENRAYLPGIPFPEKLHPVELLTDAAKDTSRFLIAVPSHAFRATLKALQPLLPEQAILAWATKGLEPGSGKLLSQVAVEALGNRHSLAVVSGPTFAREVALNLPSALTVASESEATSEAVASWLRNDRVRVYTSRDVAGVQWGGAIKNVMAIAAGISDGLGFGSNARAALITRGLAELTRLGIAMGGQKETFMGLAGAGDLILTCTDNASRNRRVGLALGQGKKLPDILSELGQEAEGVATARELYQLAKRLNVEMPITTQVYRVLYENLSPQNAVEALLKREPRQE
ncbi:MAG: NAD(P)-dependent glycerol-3-phosphate dehydrogenase [Sulfuricaulis sp.]|uniref:NAD(P)H-dependent glycerol-3-phosphate dehydrogenase n=1 Tax=Sulfuricaulis sp. TaxID=2003553 RepID=UPI0025E56E23|nr:NAD(P)H-dependent glycerol-3-phosphate dehydrogenase [Sulfuricaulis sp.]MCR4346770.1 NAD(P)-dependent glycerol-3-phosphate dehydrogenase [Sulfuricaulis sp.]